MKESIMSTAENITGQRILVIGGSRDIGFAIAQEAARAGATVIIGARKAQKAQRASATIPGGLWTTIDITDEESIITALHDIGPIDHIIVMASAHHNVPVTELDHDKVAAAFETKVIGPLMLAKHTADVLPATGSITLFSGVAAWKPERDYSIMGISNGAVAFTARHLAHELAPIRVNAISPGITDSGSWDSMGAGKQAFMKEAAAGTLAGRVGINRDIVDTALWLLSAGFVTGETIHVEGGASLA
jgi:NAD(P)-dependent dehydrogenase (short-subunit alcohol dehydrogenase family)